MSSDLLALIQQAYRMDETQCLLPLIKESILPSDMLKQIESRARDWVEAIRENRLKSRGIEAFLATYNLSSQEGVALMCLAESLLRIPDSQTIDRLIRDKITLPTWQEQLGKSQSWFVNAATWGLLLTGKILSYEDTQSGSLMAALKRFIGRMSEPVIRQTILQAMKILGKQFVMSETIEIALKRSRAAEKQGYRYSYDMLGEAAKTREDALFYFNAYSKAIEAIGRESEHFDPISGPGISVKLSALHPRYEWTNREQVFNELLPSLMELATKAKDLNMGFTIDAEEADRLELSLLLIESLVTSPELKGWKGLGVAVQSYQKRATRVIDWLIDLAEREDQFLMVRLVKGAYWDSEIKWTQERGLKDYPVFTRKAATDVSFMAAAKKLLETTAPIYPQFATHNAYTAATIFEMAKQLNKLSAFEFQCLHGMGNALYDNIVGQTNLNLPCRVYAPVGTHEHLLAYLVRRLLENGANSSFVNQIVDSNTPIETLIEDPVAKMAALPFKPHSNIPLPIALYGDRLNSRGVDFSQTLETTPLLKAIEAEFPKLFEMAFEKTTAEALDRHFREAENANRLWSETPLIERANVLNRLAGMLERDRVTLLALLIREGGKTVQDAVSELRESIDYCYYYALQLQQNLVPKELKGVTGEYNVLSLHARGMMVCISPWNFPLAIFLGQIVSALASGNCVIAKPASQTPFIARKAVELLHEAGVPEKALILAIGDSREIGSVLLENPHLAGVMLTGSTDTARQINQKLAGRSGPLLPFVAETGGQNVMIVDSTALPEQVVTDVLMSAFNSAGQRCSALRVLALQQEIAPLIIKMLKGAMAELKLNDPFELSTDVGPLIDEKARKSLLGHVERLNEEAELIYECPLPEGLPVLPRGVFFAPRAYAIKDISFLTEEVFGPILHVIEYKNENLDKLLKAINDTGYGLTLGIHTRIDERVRYIHRKARVGNVYVNRNMIGAVVGVQPFGGQGLSGTGPKAGGPHMLARLSVEKTLTINTTATGGNVALVSLEE